MFKRAMLVAVLGIPLYSGIASAQELSNRADRKITGEYFRPYTGSAYHQGAIRHAEALNYYARHYHHVPKETVTEHAAEIRRNLDAAKKEFCKLEKEAKGDKRVQAHLKIIQQHQAKADEMCAKLEKGADSQVISSCCTDIIKEIKAAEAENEKLKKTLGVEEAGEKPK